MLDGQISEDENPEESNETNKKVKIAFSAKKKLEEMKLSQIFKKGKQK